MSEAENDAKRRVVHPWRRLYGTVRWTKRRHEQLMAEPLCQRCKAKGLAIIATVAHHVVAHKGDEQLFFNGELRSSCKPCHDVIEQGIEARGYEVGCDEQGRPVDRDHPWNAAR